MCTQAGPQVTGFYDQTQIFFFKSCGGMSEHVFDHFEMENPMNLATINTKNGR